jgi:capsular exopolysaccharide synthesis family protein
MFEIQKLTESMTITRSGLTVANQKYSQVAAKLDGTLESTMEDRLIAERDPIIMRQQQTLEILESNLRAFRERLESSHPQVREAEIAVRATKDQVESKINAIIRRNLNAQLRDLITSKEQLSTQLTRLNAQIEVKDAALRDLAANQSAYEHMASLRKQLELQRDENQKLTSNLRMMQMRADASRVRQATVVLEPRSKSFPKIVIMIPAGIFFGIALYVGFIFFRETTDQKIRSASDVLIIPGAKVAGVLPDVHEDPSGLETAELAVIHSSEGIFAESCRQSWAGVNRTLQKSAHQSVMVLAVAPEAGATTIIGNYAVSAHSSGSRVVVVDCNFRRPNLAAMFDLEDSAPGVADLLTGTVELDGVVQHTESGIDVISAGTPANRLSQRLGSERMNSTFAQLRAQFDLVLVDAPPSIVAGDAVLLANLVDSIILVVHSDRDDRGMVARVLRELGESSGDIIGVVVNAAVGTVGGYFRKNYLAMISYSDREDEEDT